MKPGAAAAAAVLWLVSAGAANAQTDTAPTDNGTDPTRLSTSGGLLYEHLALRGSGSVGTLTLLYAVPLGDKQDFSLRLRAPVVRNNTLGHGGFALGDVALQLSHVFGLTREHGFVAQGELAFDTARRPELGNGKPVLKGSFAYVMFLQGGDIFAPTLVQSHSVGGDSQRARINHTEIDFYYVPKLAEPKTFVTLAPSLNFDWESKERFATLAVTLGRVLGPAFGGSSQLFVRPKVFGGAERSANWGVDVGYRVIGF
jgi:hypothetical protein